jgi:TonB-linked SusC/RagA family outer membrane protein
MCEPTVQAAVRQFFAFTLRNVNKGCVKQRVKKMLLLLCAVVIGNVYVFARAQSVEDTKITIGCANQTLDQALQLLKNAAGVQVFYMANDVQPYKSVTLEKKTRTVKETLQLLLSNTNLSYRVDGSKIMVINNRRPALAEASLPMADTVTLRGRVTNEEGKPLEGVAVQVKNSTKGTTTNSNGGFEIRAGGFPATLLFSFIGYENREYPINSFIEEISILLKPNSIKILDNVEVYSTGYQSIPRERATGSFVQIDKELLNRSVSTNVLDRLIGVVSGLNYEPRNNGDLALNQSNYVIRGISTINANAHPLIVVDGFPYDESKDNFGIIKNINPNDIESITVLKDAAAASIWGARAGNGVIVINTKKGRFNQKSNVLFNSNVTIGQKPQLSYLPTISSSDFIDFEKDLYGKGFYTSLINDPNKPVLSAVVELLNKVSKGQISATTADIEINKLRSTNVANQINDFLLRKSIVQQYSLGLLGGGEKYSYYTSIGFDKTNSNLVRDKLSRLSLRFDNSFKPFKGLEIHAYIQQTNNYNENNSLNYLFFTPVGFSKIAPYTQLSNPDGTPSAVPKGDNMGYRLSYIDTASYPNLVDWHYRPLDELYTNDNYSKQNDSRIGGQLNYIILNGLTFDFKYQYQRIQTNGQTYYAPQSYFVRNLVNQYMYKDGSGNVIYPIPNLGIIDQSLSNQIQWNYRFQLNYNKSWYNNSISFLGGYEASESSSSVRSMREYGYDPNKGTINTQINYSNYYSLRPSGNATVPNINQFGGTLNRFINYFSNASYIYKHKYILSGSARVDGSNFFGIKANQRFTPLWSVGAAWDISKEEFYKIINLPNLKLRATYGFSGNVYNLASAYPTITYSQPSSTSLNNSIYASITTPGNPLLTWEKNKVLNIALDFSSKNGILSGSVEYYRKNSINLIGPILLDYTSGLSSFTGNQASMKGNGIEVSLNAKNISGKFEWTSNLLFNYNRNFVTEYQGKAKIGSDYVNGAPVIGKPLNSIYSYKWAGLSPVNGDPRGFLSDTIASYSAVLLNAKESDLVYAGSQVPLIFGSVRNNFYWNNFSFSFNVTYKFLYFFRRNSINYYNLFNNWGGHSDYALRWKQKGDELITNIPSVPSAFTINRDDMFAKSSYLVERADHIRLQDIKIGYEFSKERYRALPFKKIEIYGYLNNVGIIWRANSSNIDPDYNNIYRIPPSMTMCIGFNINF